MLHFVQHDIGRAFSTPSPIVVIANAKPDRIVFAQPQLPPQFPLAACFVVFTRRAWQPSPLERILHKLREALPFPLLSAKVQHDSECLFSTPSWQAALIFAAYTVKYI
jgi:hypothetical protein